jgi:hypothetical protein
MNIDKQTAVFVCAGPSIDRLKPAAWRAIDEAGAVIAVNGALVAETCLASRVRFTYAAAMDVATGLVENVPGFAAAWRQTSAWRVSAHGTGAQCETQVKKVDAWSDAPDEGYAGSLGITAMAVGNWISNSWPADAQSTRALLAAAKEAGKSVPPRGFQQIAFVGLDMIEGQGGHARGAGDHRSGFSDSSSHYQQVADGWARFFQSACERGIRAVNLTPSSGLQGLPRIEVPDAWLRPF